MSRFGSVALREESFERADGDGFVNLAAAAGSFTGVRANPAAHAGHGIGVAGVTIRLFKPPLRNQRNVAAGIGSRRAGHRAGEIAIEPVAVDFLVAKSHSHSSLVPSSTAPGFCYFDKVKSNAASPVTFTGFDCTFMPSCQAATLYWPS